MPLFKFAVLTIYTRKLTAFEVIQLSSHADDIMSMTVAEVIKPIEQVGLMVSDNSWGSLCIPKSKYVITAIMNSWSSLIVYCILCKYVIVVWV